MKSYRQIFLRLMIIDFAKKFLKYEKQMHSFQTKWQALSQNNEELKLLLSTERTSKLENSVRSSELALKLRDFERECQEACKKLRILVSNSNASSTEEIKCLNNEIKSVKKNSELAGKYDALKCKCRNDKRDFDRTILKIYIILKK